MNNSTFAAQTKENSIVSCINPHLQGDVTVDRELNIFKYYLKKINSFRELRISNV